MIYIYIYKGQYSFSPTMWRKIFQGLINCCCSIFYFIFLSTSIDESAFQSTPCKATEWLLDYKHMTYLGMNCIVPSKGFCLSSYSLRRYLTTQEACTYLVKNLSCYTVRCSLTSSLMPLTELRGLDLQIGFFTYRQIRLPLITSMLQIRLGKVVLD